MLASEELEKQMSDLERNAWQAFRMIMEGFLENHPKRRLCNGGVKFD